MATELERLIVSLEASTTKYERALAKANGTTNTQLRRMESRMTQSAKRMNVSLGGVFKGFAAGFALHAAQQLIDSSIKIENALKVAGLAGEDLTKVYDKLFASAQRNGAPLEALATLYGRVAQVQGELGISADQLTKFTDNVAIALRVSGRSAEESKGALLQLGQALGGTIVRAEEFNSINEGALPILQAVAGGLKEAGGSVAKLRALVIDGKVPSKAFFDAFEAGADVLTGKLANAELTISQGFVRFQNVLINAAGDFNDATSLSEGLGVALDGLSGFVDKVGQAFLDAKPGIDAFYGAIQTGAASTSEFLKGKQQSNGETTFFEPVDWDAMAQFVGSLFGAGGGTANPTLDQTPGSLPVPITSTGTQAGGLPVPLGAVVPVKVVSGPAGLLPGQSAVRPEGPVGSLPASKVKPVSLDDYDIPGSDDASLKKIEKARQAVKDMISDLEFEKSLIGLSELEQQKLTAAREAGAEATDAQRERIVALTEEIYLEQEAAEYLKDLYEELGNVAQSAIQGIISALGDGKIEAEEFGEILSNVLGQLGNFFLSQAFGSGSNGFASIFGSIFGGGRAAGGPVEAGKVYKVNENTPNSEYFAPTEDGVIIPRIPAGAGGASSQGGTVFNIDARGAQLGVGEEIRRALQDYDRHTLPGRVNQINKDPLAKG